MALAVALGIALWIAAAPVAAQDYDPKMAGHPLRVVAYVLHPVGVILDYMIFRPAWYIGGHEPFRTLFGRQPPYPTSVPAPTPPPTPPQSPPAP